ncbi:MAG: glycosyltransferase family 4 protein [Beijerinckiaceae bacterium]
MTSGVTSVAFCIPGDLALPTGGYRYDREVLARLGGQGLDVRHVRLAGGYPAPSVDDIAATASVLKAIDRKTLLLIDGLALGAMPPDLIGALPHKIIALIHHPLGLEAGLLPERERFLLANEKAVLARVRHVIVTSALTARTLEQDFAVPHHALTVAEPGTARALRTRGTGKPVRILAVGAVSPRKAYDRLVSALAPLAALDWHLTIAGALNRAEDTVNALRDLIADSGCPDRFTLAGPVSDEALAALYDQSDLFAMSSLYEGYGMALTEALARGLPIVTSSGGAAAETVPDAAALKVPPGDVMLLSDALYRTISDATLRRRMADAAWAAGALLPTWDDTAHDIAEAIRAFA